MAKGFETQFVMIDGLAVAAVRSLSLPLKAKTHAQSQTHRASGLSASGLFLLDHTPIME